MSMHSEKIIFFCIDETQMKIKKFYFIFLFDFFIYEFHFFIVKTSHS